MKECKMTEEKQIEEMKHIACLGCKHLMECDESIRERCGFMVLIEALYAEGYRKQREGEWIKHPCSYECTVCKVSVEVYAEEYDPTTDYDLNYCPNCGAKMKGGAE